LELVDNIKFVGSTDVQRDEKAKLDAGLGDFLDITSRSKFMFLISISRSIEFFSIN
jgi:hypothetical protein